METYIFEFLFVAFQIAFVAGIVAIARHGKKKMPIPSYPGRAGVRFDYKRRLTMPENPMLNNPMYSSMPGNIYHDTAIDVTSINNF